MRIHWTNEPAVTIQLGNTILRRDWNWQNLKRFEIKDENWKLSLKEKLKGSRQNAQTLEILFKVRKHGTVYVKKKKIKHNLNQYLPPNFRVNY